MNRVEFPARREQTQKTRWRTISFNVIPLTIALVGLFAYLSGGRFVETDNAYVKATKVLVGSEVSGRILQVMVNENQYVHAGQVLLEIDPKLYEVAVARAEAQLGEVRANLLAMQASYREMQAQIALATTTWEYAKRERQRQYDLAEKRFVSKATLDSVEQNEQSTRDKIVAMEEDLKRIGENLDGRITGDITQHPQYLVAAAALDQARLDLTHTRIVASMDGTVSHVPNRGQYLESGAVAIALVATGKLWIEANFPETDLTYVRPGQSTVVHIDTYPDLELRGVVESLSPATGAEFSVIPAQNATGNWVRITQRVPVRIHLDGKANLPPMMSGLSAKVEIDTGHKRRIFW